MSTTQRVVYFVAIVLCATFVSSQHNHGNPSNNGNNNGGGEGGASMKYKDAGFRLSVHSEGFNCDENLMTPNGPSSSASNILLERPQHWAYYHPFRLYFCGVTSVMPISYEMRIEIENKSIAQFSMADGYHQVRTFNWIAHVCHGENNNDPICWDKIRKSDAIMICLESGVTKAHINFYFPGSGEHVHTDIQLLCNGTDYDRLYWKNPAYGHWLPGGGPFIGYTILLLLELGIIKSSNYKPNNEIRIKKEGNRKRRKSVEIDTSSDTNSEEENNGLNGVTLDDDNDDLVVSQRRTTRGTVVTRIIRRAKNVAKKTWVALGFENFVLVATGFGVFVAHIPHGNIAWADPFNLMHMMLGGTMLVMGLVGTLFNTRYMAKITFNFTVSLTLITLGIMMKYHEQEEGLIGIVHDTFTYGIVISGLFRMISDFLPTFKLLFIVTGIWATFTFALGSPAWMISFINLGIMDVTFVIFTGFVSISWVCFWVFIGYIVHKRRETPGYHSLNGESIAMQAL
jgi:hypothetical protein